MRPRLLGTPVPELRRRLLPREKLQRQRRRLCRCRRSQIIIMIIRFSFCFITNQPPPPSPPRSPPCRAACYHSCKKCAGPEDYKCLDCKAGWMLHDNKCVGECVFTAPTASGRCSRPRLCAVSLTLCVS